MALRRGQHQNHSSCIAVALPAPTPVVYSVSPGIHPPTDTALATHLEFDVQAAIDNTPMMQPLWFQWPEQQDLFAVDDQFMVGDAIMVKPVVSAGTTSVSVQLPGTDPWCACSMLFLCNVLSIFAAKSVDLRIV